VESGSGIQQYSHLSLETHICNEMDTHARLSANLQRVYTAYKEKGVTPLTP